MPKPTCSDLLRKILTAPFPQQTEHVYQVIIDEAEDIPHITPEELTKACSKVGNVVKMAIKVTPELFSDTHDACLREGTFPVLLPKRKKPPDEASSYRPLCMLDTAGKILERIIHNRIEAVIGDSLAGNQYGFRKSRSTVDAVSRVIDTAKQAISERKWNRGAKKYCLVATLDLKTRSTQQDGTASGGH